MFVSVLFCFVITPHLVSSQTISGKATFYGAGTTGGNCGLPNQPPFPNGMVVAIGNPRYGNSEGCGACYEVTCVGPQNCCTTSTPIVVQAWDRCPECSSTHLDLGESAFLKIGVKTCGIININFKPVNCPFSGNIIIKNKDGTNNWWYALFVFNVGGKGTIQTVEIRESGSANWQKMTRQQYNGHLITSSSGLKTPLSIRLTSGDGQVLTANDVVTSTAGDASFDFGKNFGNGGGGGSQPTTTKKPTAKVTPRPTPPPVPPIPTSNLQVKIQEGANKWWFAVYVQNQRGTNQGVSWVQVKDSTTNWLDMTKSQWNYWVYQNNNGFKVPITVRFLLTTDRKQYVACIDVVKPSQVFTGVSQGTSIFCPSTGSSNTGGSNGNGGGGGSSSKESSNKNILGVVFGVAGGLMCIVLLVVGIIWYRRKKKMEANQKGEPLLGEYHPPSRTIE